MIEARLPSSSNAAVQLSRSGPWSIMWAITNSCLMLATSAAPQVAAQPPGRAIKVLSSSQLCGNDGQASEQPASPSSSSSSSSLQLQLAAFVMEVVMLSMFTTKVVHMASENICMPNSPALHVMMP